MLQRQYTNRDRNYGHQHRCAEQEGNREPLVLAKFDLRESHNQERSGVRGLTGKPVVIWPSSAARAT